MKAQAYRHPLPDFLAELTRRRGLLLERLGDAACILQGYASDLGPVSHKIPFKQETHFQYLTGVEESGAVAVFAPARTGERAVLFLPPRDAFAELWNGPMTDIGAAAASFGFDACYPVDEIAKRLPELLKGASAVYGARGAMRASQTQVDSALAASRLRENGIEWRDVSVLAGEMRLVKSAWEIAQLREAGRIGACMHEIAMSEGRPGTTEFKLQALLEAAARAQGSLWLGYPSIVAAGENATCLHYRVNNCTVEDGELVLIDAGCEWNGFTSDITRTFPASGRFSAEQRALYEVVLSAQTKALALARPGATLKALADGAIDVLLDGLIDLGLLKGDRRVLLEEKKYKDFYPHGLSHWLGLDVHDVGAYETNGAHRPLEPGMCFTVEPGLYVQPTADVPDRWKGIGIRIEDDIVITADGHENLTPCVKETDAVEAICSGRRS